MPRRSTRARHAHNSRAVVDADSESDGADAAADVSNEAQLWGDVALPFEVGAKVYWYKGAVTAVTRQPSGDYVCCVTFVDGEVQDDLSATEVVKAAADYLVQSERTDGCFIDTKAAADAVMTDVTRDKLKRQMSRVGGAAARDDDEHVGVMKTHNHDFTSAGAECGRAAIRTARAMQPRPGYGAGQAGTGIKESV